MREVIDLLHRTLHCHLVEIINFYETHDIPYKIQVSTNGRQEFVVVLTRHYMVCSRLRGMVLEFPVVEFLN